MKIFRNYQEKLLHFAVLYQIALLSWPAMRYYDIITAKIINLYINNWFQYIYTVYISIPAVYYKQAYTMPYTYIYNIF